MQSVIEYSVYVHLNIMTALLIFGHGAILSHQYKLFMDFTYCICEHGLSLFFVQVYESPTGATPSRAPFC